MIQFSERDLETLISVNPNMRKVYIMGLKKAYNIAFEENENSMVLSAIPNKIKKEIEKYELNQ